MSEVEKQLTSLDKGLDGYTIEVQQVLTVKQVIVMILASERASLCS